MSVQRFEKTGMEDVLADMGLQNNKDRPVRDRLEQMRQGKMILDEPQAKAMDEDKGPWRVEVVPTIGGRPEQVPAR